MNTATRNERIGALITDLAGEVSLELHDIDAERWQYINVLTNASSALLARGLGIHQAGAACERAASAPVTDGNMDPPKSIIGWEYSARDLLSAAILPWIILTHNSETGARHRAAFERYRSCWPALTAPLPAPGDPWSAWLAFYACLEVAEYTAGGNVAAFAIIGQGAISDADMAHGRAAAMLALEARHGGLVAIYGRAFHPPAPPTPEEAQIAPVE